MTDNYQLMSGATLAGWEAEVTNGTDPALGRNPWPGAIIGIPSLSEDFGHKDFQPLGSGPDPQIVISTKEEYEVEIESLVSEPFAGADDFLRLSMGTVNPTTGVVTFSQPLPTFTLEWGYSGGAEPWFHLMRGCKIDSVSFTFRPEDVIMMRVKVIGRIHTKSATVVSTAGDDLTDLTVTTNPGAIHEHVTYTLNNVPSGAISSQIIKEFDLTWTNNLERIFSDNQSRFASQLIEGKRRFTFSIVTAKVDDQLWDISQARPSTDAGKLDIVITISQPSGFFMEIDMPTCVLAERSADLNQDLSHVSESFAGMMVGVPSVDLSPTA